MRVINDYFTDRVLYYASDNGFRRYEVMCGVLQSPLLWNVMYDGVFRLPMPDGVTVVGFADDVAVVIVAKYIEDITLIANQAVAIIRKWLTSVGLQLADHKTEALLVSSRKQIETVTLTVGRNEIRSQPYLKYLGVLINEHLQFNAHTEYISAKAARITSLLTRLTPNIGGPKESRRKFLATVVSSILLYGAPI